jgi:hypothetical protein
VYWIFKAEPKCLFISETGDKQWHKFSTPQAIASVIVGLGKDPPSESLKEVYPEAVTLVKNRMWSTLLMQQNVSPVSSDRTGSGATSLGESGEENKFGLVSFKTTFGFLRFIYLLTCFYCNDAAICRRRRRFG